jgi:hypothetical protein
MKYIVPTILVLTFVGFIAFLIIGMVIKSIPFIATAFLVGFVGYAIGGYVINEENLAHKTKQASSHKEQDQ